MSDWYGTHSTAPAANAGPRPRDARARRSGSAPKLADAVRAGEVDEKRLDDKVRRVLALLDRTGRARRCRRSRRRGVDRRSRSTATSRGAAAAESFVLLQQPRRRPPLAARRGVPHARGDRAERRRRARDPGRRQRAGADASARSRRSPGSAPRFGDDVEIEHERGCTSYKITPLLDTRVLDGRSQVAYYAGRERAGEPVLVEDARPRLLHVDGSGRRASVPDEFSVRHHRHVSCRRDRARGRSALVQAGRARLLARRRGRRRQLEPDRAQRGVLWASGSAEVDGDGRSRRGRAATTLEVEAIPAAPALGGLVDRAARRRRRRPASSARSRSRARADAVVCVVGTDGEWETEGNDRESMTLPGAAGRARARGRGGEPAHGRRRERGVAGRRCRGPTTSPRCCSAGSRARSGATRSPTCCRGDVSPSGKLPTTFPVRIEDTPAFTSYPGEDGEVHYGEGVFVGYRWYDARDDRAALLLRPRALVHDVRARRRSRSRCARRGHRRRRCASTFP